MRIDKVKIKNFFSIKEAEVDFTSYQDDIIFIEGRNLDSGGSNGAGKSVLFEAVVWGLFGRSIRKTTEASMVNNEVKKECEVKLLIDGKYIIHRTRKPTSLNFSCFAGGTEIPLTGQNATETQTKINETFKTDYKTFVASTVFGQHSNFEFLGADAADKRQVIKNFLGLDKEFETREQIRPYKANLTAIKKGIEGAKDEVERSITKLEQDISLAGGASSLELPSMSLSEILSLEDRIRSLEMELSAEQHEKVICEQAYSYLFNKYEKGTYSEYEPCGECGTKVETSQTEEDLAELERQMEVTALTMEGLIKKIDELEVELFSLQDKLPLSSKEYVAQQHQFKVAENLVANVELLTQLKSRHFDLLEEHKDVVRKLSIIKIWEQVFSEKGVIRFIIHNIRDYLNSKINYYLSILSENITFEFDDSLQEKIEQGNKRVYYYSLSGGEKRKVNLAVMFALQTLLSLFGKADSNLLFLDEVTENIDEEGARRVYILLQELKKDRNLLIITHNSSLKNEIEDCKKIVVSKKRGISKLQQ